MVTTKKGKPPNEATTNATSSTSNMQHPPKFSLRKQPPLRTELPATVERSPCTVRRAVGSSTELTPMEAARIRATFYSSRSEYGGEHLCRDLDPVRHELGWGSLQHDAVVASPVACPRSHAKRMKRFKDVDAYLFGRELSPSRAAAVPSTSPTVRRTSPPEVPQGCSPTSPAVTTKPRPMTYHTPSHVRRSLKNQLLAEARAGITPRNQRDGPARGL